MESLYLSFEQKKNDSNSENYLSIFISSNVQLWKLVFEKFSPFAVVMESRLGGGHLFALLFAFQQTRFSTSYFMHFWAFGSRHFDNEIAEVIIRVLRSEVRKCWDDGIYSPGIITVVAAGGLFMFWYVPMSIQLLWFTVINNSCYDGEARNLILWLIPVTKTSFSICHNYLGLAQ